MFYDNKGKKEQNADSALLSGLTRRQLKELEEKEKTPAQKLREAVIMLLPLLCGCVAPGPGHPAGAATVKKHLCRHRPLHSS